VLEPCLSIAVFHYVDYYFTFRISEKKKQIQITKSNNPIGLKKKLQTYTTHKKKKKREEGPFIP
jgi:hypothetical protein